MQRRTVGIGVLALAFCPALARSQDLADLAPFVPPACVPGQEMFTDVPASNPFCPWIEQLARDHVTGGCGPQLFCPGAPLTRAQMAAFLELAMRGTDTWIVDADLLDGRDSTEFVTGVSAGAGLTGGGSGGNLTLGVADSYQLPQTCNGGQHPRWTGTGWGCGDPGTGTVTSVATGGGLTGGPITTSGTISVAAGGITSAMIADGTVAGADVADGSIGAADVAPAQVQLRVAAPCAAGEFMRRVNADGTVACGPDLDSGGTVTSVATGAGLTGGPITGSGTLSVAPGGIGSAMIASGAVGSAHVADGSIGASDVASAQVQLRVSQACAASQFMRAVNVDGTVTCAGDASHSHFGQQWSGNSPGSGLLVVNSGGGASLYGLSGASSGGGVRGGATATEGNTYGVEGTSNSPLGKGVIGVASALTGAAHGVFGRSRSTEGVGVYGEAIATGGQAYGVYGLTPSTQGRGVQGEASATSGPAYGVVGTSASSSGIGVAGAATALTGTAAGVQGTSSSTSGRGLMGLTTAASGFALGVLGISASTSGTGVRGDATAASGLTYGVAGSSASPTGRAVAGEATSASGQSFGVEGITRSSSGAGLAGFAFATSGENYGVYGSTSSPSGWGGYFSGRVHVTSHLSVAGNLSVSGVKSFKIDHPLDPANKYLVHAAVESSEVLNMYSGTVVLDEAGTAVVGLPDWFEALNRDFRYQLTCIGGYAPVYVASEIEGGRFGIAGGRPGLKVSWQVVGTRSDAHALAHPMDVEQEKPAEERGTYLDPEAHGQPAELGRDHRITSALPREQRTSAREQRGARLTRGAGRLECAANPQRHGIARPPAARATRGEGE